MKKILLFICILSVQLVIAQELYVFTEPASNMAAKSLGLRLNTKVFKMTHDNKFSSYRLDPEIMIGISKNLMVHLNGYASDMFQSNLKVEGASLYAKYRFLSRDDIHSHFRLAAYGKIAFIDNPTVLNSLGKHEIDDGSGGIIVHDIIHTTVNNEIDIDGTNSGLATGIIATKLINKLAVSSSLGYLYRLDNLRNKREVIVPWRAISYSLSAGYLLFPKEYTSYTQTNINLYTEFLGNSTWDNKKYFIDIAPAIQFIINSIARVDIGYRTQLSGNTQRMANSAFLLRVEYNFLNVFSKK
ncbi:hypothetical protein [Ferruginibacter sp.]|nr:hypothetical protein [Ferruginibacter sp.]